MKANTGTVRIGAGGFSRPGTSAHRYLVNRAPSVAVSHAQLCRLDAVVTAIVTLTGVFSLLSTIVGMMLSIAGEDRFVLPAMTNAVCSSGVFLLLLGCLRIIEIVTESSARG